MTANSAWPGLSCRVRSGGRRVGPGNGLLNVSLDLVMRRAHTALPTWLRT
jgi:hypothetical protein